MRITTLLATAAVTMIASHAHALEFAVAANFDGQPGDEIAVVERLGPTSYPRGISIYSATDGQLDRDSIVQIDPNTLETPVPAEGVGVSALATGDFNGDTRPDLAFLGLFRLLDESGSANYLYVVLGDADGIDPSAVQRVDHTGLSSTTVVPNSYGPSTLAAGDFNGDGYADLAVGDPLANVERGGATVRRAGAVYILRGMSAGLMMLGIRVLTQETEGVPGVAEADDSFGAKLVVGNFNGDRTVQGAVLADLVVGSPREEVNGVQAAGAVHTFYGAVGGMTGVQSEMLTGSDQGDRVGAVLAAGDANGDGYTDLAVGLPSRWWYAGVNVFPLAGAVQLSHGRPTGVPASAPVMVQPARSDIQGGATAEERFGAQVYFADTDGDERAELIVRSGSGRDTIHVVHSNPSRPNTFDGRVFSINALFGDANAYPDFLATGDFNGDGMAEFALQAHDEKQWVIRRGARDRSSEGSYFFRPSWVE